MKKTRLMLTVTIIISIFTVCFLIGRATALKERNEEEYKPQNSTGTVRIPGKDEETTETSINVNGIAESKTVQQKVVEETAQPKKEPPNQMLFPSGKVVLNPYSQIAVHSKTTDDWRAHLGIDYAAAIGSDVLSIWDGIVSEVYEDKLWGYCVEIIHTGDVIGIYRNLQKDISVTAGQTVFRGQAIGKVGNSASVEKLEEPHLHFELWMQGEPINPVSFIY